MKSRRPKQNRELISDAKRKQIQAAGYRALREFYTIEDEAFADAAQQMAAEAFDEQGPPPRKAPPS